MTQQINIQQVSTATATCTECNREIQDSLAGYRAQDACCRDCLARDSPVLAFLILLHTAIMTGVSGEDLSRLGKQYKRTVLVEARVASSNW